MNRKKTVSAIVLATIIAGLAITSTNADFSDRGLNSDIFEKVQLFKKGHNGMMKGLTDEEKTSLESMTSEEKKAFFEAKKEERKAEIEAKKLQIEAHENVIDKLLKGETLTSQEETLRAEIIEKRAERKAKMEARKAKMEEIKTIIEKKRSGEELSEDEEAKLEEMKSKFKWFNWKKGKRGGHWMKRFAR